LSAAHDKLLRGRKLIVTFAHQAPIDQVGSGSLGGAKRKGMMDVGRPTALSMLKTGLGGRNDATRNKIARMEAKLRQMEDSNPKPLLSESTPTATSSTLPHHTSLPTKPPPPNLAAGLLNLQPHPRSGSKPKSPLPSLPILPQSKTQSTSQSFVKEGKSSTTPSRQPKSAKFVGVKIHKPKEKQVLPEAG